MTPALSYHDVTKIYGEQIALDDVSFDRDDRPAMELTFWGTRRFYAASYPSLSWQLTHYWMALERRDDASA